MDRGQGAGRNQNKGNVQSNSEARFGVGDVAGDLFFEGVEGGELLFVAQFIHEVDFDFLAVKVGIEIEEVSFDAKLWIGGIDGGAAADVDDGAVRVALALNAGEVNPIGRQDEAGDVEIGGGKSEFAAELITFYDGTRQRIGTSQHLAGGIEVAGADGFADAGAADGLAIEGNRRHSMHGEVEFFTKGFQEADIATPFVAEGEVASHAKALELAEVARKAADEGFAGLFAERAVKMNQQQRIGGKGADDAQFLGERIDQRGDAIGRDDGVGVAVESDHEGDGFVLDGVGDGLADDLLVPQVDAVEEADGETDLASVGLQLTRGADDFHGLGKTGLSGQFQKGNHTFFEFTGRQREDLLEFNGIGNVEFTGDDAPQGGEEGAATELLPEFMGEAPHIKALGAGHTETADGFVVIGEFEVVNMHEPGLTLDFNSLAGKFVERHALDLDGRDYGRHLHLVANECGGGGIQFRQGDGRHGEGGDQFARGIVAVSRLTELNGAFVNLVRGHEFFGEFCSTSQDDDEEAGGVGIKGAAMADFLEPELGANGVHDIVRSRAGRFVDQDGAIKGIKLVHNRQSPTNTGRELSGGVQGFFDGVYHPALDGKRRAGNARAGGRPMPTAAKFSGDFVHVHLVALGTEADAREVWFHLFEEAGDDDGFDGANMVDQALGVVGARAGAVKVRLLQPEPGDLVVMGEVEVIIDMLQKTRAGERIGLVNFVADPGEVGAAFDEFAGDVVGAGPGVGILEGAGVGGDGGEKAIRDGRGDGPIGGLQEAEDDFTAGRLAGGDPVDVAIAGVAGVMVDIDEELAAANRVADLAETFEAGAISGDDAIKLLTGAGFLNEMAGVEKGVFMRHGIFIPAGDLFAQGLQCEGQPELRTDAIAVGADVADHADGAAGVDALEDAVNDLRVQFHQGFQNVPIPQ